MHRVTIITTETKLTEEQRANLSIIIASDVPEGEKEIIRKAIQNDEYWECYPGSEELQSFVERIERRKGEQFDNYDGKSPDYLFSVYLRRQATYYKLYVTVQDVVISGP